MKANYVFTNAEGKLDIMSHDEAQAIERSGPPSSWRTYANVRLDFGERHPVVPLMHKRPGKTSADYIMDAERMDRNGSPWTYREMCDLLKDDPSSKEQVRRFAMLTNRSMDSVSSQRTKLLRKIWSRHIRFDGERIVPGKYGRMDQWPLTALSAQQ